MSTRTCDRLRASVSPVGHPWRENLGEREGLPRRGGPNPPLGIEFSTEENPNRHKGEAWNRDTFEGERDILEKLFRRERVLGLFMKTDITV
jgi:hypothetical protein